MKVQLSYQTGYTAYADYEDFTITYHKGDMPAHNIEQYDSQAEMERAMSDNAPVSEWQEVEE